MTTPETASKQEIVVVEDNLDMRELLRDFLSGEGYRVRSFPSAIEALSVLREGKKVDALISDVGLPGMSGFELLSIVKQEHPEIPVLLVSAFGNSINGESARRRGASDYLMKPFPLSVLHLSLKRALTGTCAERSRRA